MYDTYTNTFAVDVLECFGWVMLVQNNDEPFIPVCVSKKSSKNDPKTSVCPSDNITSELSGVVKVEHRKNPKDLHI